MILVSYCSSTSMITIMKNIIRLHHYQPNSCIDKTYIVTNYELGRRAFCETYLEGLSGLETGHIMMFDVPKEHRRKFEEHSWMAIPPNVNYAFVLEVHPCQPRQTNYKPQSTDDRFYGIVKNVVYG